MSEGSVTSDEWYTKYNRRMLIGEALITAMFVILFVRHLSLEVFNGWTIFYGISMLTGLPFIFYRCMMMARLAKKRSAGHEK